MNSKLYGVKLIMFLCSVLILASGVTACRDTEYKVMSVKEGIQGFTFEYPRDYSLIHLNLENTSMARYSEVGLSSYDGENYSEIYIYIWFPTSDMSSAELIINKLLDNGRNTLKDFSLVSEATVMIEDTIARQAVFTADSAGSDNSSPASPRPATYRLTSMLYSGLAVEIDMTCDTSIIDATADHYQHVLDTFAVLD